MVMHLNRSRRSDERSRNLATMLHWVMLLAATLLMVLPDYAVALKDVSVTIPQAVKRGNNALLVCNYDMENDTLYSVKWYKGRREFYRYTPKENPAMKVFSMVTSGLNVERNLSNQSHVVLLSVPLNISGKFTCEISVEAPSFQTAMVSGEMEVVELPEQQATVTGIQPRYRIGDLVDGNCSIKFSKPAANLTWTINGIVVPPHHIKTYQIEKHENHNLESVLSALNFMVTTQHFVKGQMKLKCTASIFNIYNEEIENIIEEDRPRIMASGRSYDINAYPYDQHSSGDGFEDHNESYLTYYSAADMHSAGAPTARPILANINKKWQHYWNKLQLYSDTSVSSSSSAAVSSESSSSMEASLSPAKTSNAHPLTPSSIQRNVKRYFWQIFALFARQIESEKRIEIEIKAVVKNALKMEEEANDEMRLLSHNRWRFSWRLALIAHIGVVLALIIAGLCVALFQRRHHQLEQQQQQRQQRQQVSSHQQHKRNARSCQHKAATSTKCCQGPVSPLCLFNDLLSTDRESALPDIDAAKSFYNCAHCKSSIACQRQLSLMLLTTSDNNAQEFHYFMANVRRIVGVVPTPNTLSKLRMTTANGRCCCC